MEGLEGIEEEEETPRSKSDLNINTKKRLVKEQAMGMSTVYLEEHVHGEIVNSVCVRKKNILENMFQGNK